MNRTCEERAHLNRDTRLWPLPGELAATTEDLETRLPKLLKLVRSRAAGFGRHGSGEA